MALHLTLASDSRQLCLCAGLNWNLSFFCKRFVLNVHANKELRFKSTVYKLCELQHIFSVVAYVILRPTVQWYLIYLKLLTYSYQREKNELIKTPLLTMLLTKLLFVWFATYIWNEPIWWYICITTSHIGSLYSNITIIVILLLYTENQ